MDDILSSNSQLPHPGHYDPGTGWRGLEGPLPGHCRSSPGLAHAVHIPPAAADAFKTALVAIDVQNTFCIPGFELFVGGRSGTGAVEDNRRLCEFIYRNLGQLTQITATLDTHTAMQIFHPLFSGRCRQGKHPAAADPGFVR